MPHRRHRYERHCYHHNTYISSKIIEDLGGSISVISELGKGSIFTINLPGVIYSDDKVEEGEVSYTFFGDSVLIADDVPVNIKLYKAYLSQYNLRVRTATDGKDLLEKVRKFRPQLIVTDFGMPNLNADEVLEALRKENIETPVILISALKLDESIKKGFQSFLQKPVEEQVFLKEVATETESITTSTATLANFFCSSSEIPSLSKVFFISGSRSSKLSKTGFCFGAE